MSDEHIEEQNIETYLFSSLFSFLQNCISASNTNSSLDNRLFTKSHYTSFKLVRRKTYSLPLLYTNKGLSGTRLNYILNNRSTKSIKYSTTKKYIYSHHVETTSNNLSIIIIKYIINMFQFNTTIPIHNENILS